MKLRQANNTDFCEYSTFYIKPKRKKALNYYIKKYTYKTHYNHVG